MNKNDIVELYIEDLTNEGEGVGKVDGFPFFVKDAVIGDRILARVTKLKKNYGYGRVEEIVEPSPKRVDCKCSFARQCGGCQIQALSYEAQLEFKARKVRNNLVRLGGFSQELVDSVMQPIIGMEKEGPFGYRNKAQFPIGNDKDGNPICGFYAGRTHHIIPNTDCALGVKINEPILEIILAYIKEFGVSAYEEESGKGLLRHVLLRYGFSSGEIMVCLVVNGNRLPKEEILIERLCKLEGMTSITLNTNTKNTNVILGEELRTLWGRDYISDSLDGIEFHISPLSFYQVNPVQTVKLYGKALEYANREKLKEENPEQETISGDLENDHVVNGLKEKVIWDLYCGIGTISLFLARKAKKVYGVEIIPQAIADAKENAARNGLNNTEFFVGKAEDIAPDLPRPDVIVVDPPRKGCDERLLQTILENQPERVVYVSCDSATLARDLKILCAGGYDLVEVTPVDQFPQTVHVEVAALLSKSN